MTEVEINIAHNIKVQRKRLALTIEELANQVGVSRATLSRIENYEVSPTAQVLAKLCLCFDISLSSFMQRAEQTRGSHIVASEQAVWQEKALGFRRQVISPPSEELKGEAIVGEIQAGKRIDYDAPTKPGLEHHLYMLEGQLQLTVANEEYVLNEGDCLRYKTHSTTSFKTSDAAAKYLLFMV